MFYSPFLSNFVCYHIYLVYFIKFNQSINNKFTISKINGNIVYELFTTKNKDRHTSNTYPLFTMKYNLLILQVYVFTYLINFNAYFLLIFVHIFLTFCSNDDNLLLLKKKN